MGKNESRDQLLGALIGLAKTCNSHVKESSTDEILILGVRVLQTADSDEKIVQMLDQVHSEKTKIAPDCSTCPNPCGNSDDYDVQQIWDAPDEMFSLKVKLLVAVKRLAEKLDIDQIENQADLMGLFHKGLCVLGYDVKLDYLKEVVEILESVTKEH